MSASLAVSENGVLEEAAPAAHDQEAILAPSIGRTDAGAAVAPRFEQRDISGIDVLVADRFAASSAIRARLDAGRFAKVAFLNAHCVNISHRNERYRGVLADFFVLADGVGIDLASQLLYGASFPENLNGTDFVPFLLQEIERPLRVALVGAAPGVIERAASRFADIAPQHVYIPVSHGYFSGEEETAVVMAALRQERCDILLVGLGVPRQELFIADLDPGTATVAIGVGALFDFVGGRVPRAPKLLRKLRLEWLYRLAIEPRRLWRRYILGNPAFLARILGAMRRKAAGLP